MKIILSTRNPSKAEQIRAIFAGSSFTILTLDDAGIVGEGVEDGVSLEENAFKKARFSHEQSEGVWTMADDTGLFINHLNGEPGIKAARWAGENASTDEITAHTLKKLEGALDRSARFETVVALVSPKGKVHYFSGEIWGIILESPKAMPQPKMPYSGIFMPDQANKVWAEMTVEEENLISHRGKAFREARAFLESLSEK